MKQQVGSGRRYDAPFKEQAVKLVLSSGRPADRIAKELGVSGPALRKWRDDYLARGQTRDRTAAELHIENQRLRRELERVTTQRDILKKSLGILSEEPPQKGMPK